MRVDDLTLHQDDNFAPEAEASSDGNGLPSPPLCPTVWFVTVSDFDGTVVASTAKRLDKEVQQALNSVPVAQGSHSSLCTWARHAGP